MSINEIGENDQIFFNLQKTKEIDLIIFSKEKKEREQEKYSQTLNMKQIINILNMLPQEFRENLKRPYIIDDYSDNKKNQPEESSKEDLYIKAKKSKKYKKFKELIIVNIGSFTILKSLWKLYYSHKTFYIILFLNIFLPGFGTIVAGIGWGKTCQYKNRTCELILRGIFQFLTFYLIYGWIRSIQDAVNYFAVIK